MSLVVDSEICLLGILIGDDGGSRGEVMGSILPGVHGMTNMYGVTPEKQIGPSWTRCMMCMVSAALRKSVIRPVDILSK